MSRLREKRGGGRRTEERGGRDEVRDPNRKRDGERDKETDIQTHREGKQINKNQERKKKSETYIKTG